MGARYQFGHARRTARELENRGVGRINLERAQILRPFLRLAGDQVREREETCGRLAEHDSQPDRWRLAAHPTDHFPEVEVTITIRRNAGRGPGELRELAHFEKAVRDESRDRDAADFLQCEIEEHELDDIRKLHDHAIERHEAGLEQIQGEAVGDAVDFGVGKARVPIDDGGAIGVPLEYRRELPGERFLPPVALLAVTLRELGWKRDDALKHLPSLSV